MGGGIDNPAPISVINYYYAPGAPTSGDLEAATKTIAAVAEPAGADYTWTGGPAAPTNALITVARLAVRLQLTIDSFAGGGTTLNYRVKADGVSVMTGAIATGGSTGAKYAAADVTAGTLTGNKVYTVHLWVDGGTCVVSVCQIWALVGRAYSAGDYWGGVVIGCAHKGWLSVGAYMLRKGTGTMYGFLLSTSAALWSTHVLGQNVGGAVTEMAFGNKPFQGWGDVTVRLCSTGVVGDVAHISGIGFHLGVE